MTENNADIKQRVEQTLARAFEVSPNEVAALGMGLHPRWDSMGHMDLIMQIEKEFGLRFPTYEIAELTNPAAIVKAVERHAQK
jgi:acyl carrier protein